MGRGYNGRELPAIALTAYARTEDRRRALMSGYQMHVAKPVDPNELAEVVASLAGARGWISGRPQSCRRCVPRQRYGLFSIN